MGSSWSDLIGQLSVNSHSISDSLKALDAFRAAASDVSPEAIASLEMRENAVTFLLEMSNEAMNDICGEVSRGDNTNKGVHYGPEVRQLSAALDGLRILLSAMMQLPENCVSRMQFSSSSKLRISQSRKEGRLQTTRNLAWNLRISQNIHLCQRLSVVSLQMQKVRCYAPCRCNFLPRWSVAWRWRYARSSRRTLPSPRVGSPPGIHDNWFGTGSCLFSLSQRLCWYWNGSCSESGC